MNESYAEHDEFLPDGAMVIALVSDVKSTDEILTEPTTARTIFISVFYRSLCNGTASLAVRVSFSSSDISRRWGRCMG